MAEAGKEFLGTQRFNFSRKLGRQVSEARPC